MIATDGSAIASPFMLEQLILAPGKRAELLVQGNQEPGEYRLLNWPFNPARGGSGSSGGMMSRMHGASSASKSALNRSETVATLSYSGEVTSVPLPTQLISVAPLPKAQTTRQFTLNHGMSEERSGAMMGGMGGGMTFVINGKAFDHSRVDTQVKLGTVEDWEIINADPHGMAHPFHVHINKFQILSLNDQPIPYTVWKDVVSVGPGDRIKLRIAFDDYVGKTVYHCHVLDHEDLGMMGTLEIVA